MSKTIAILLITLMAMMSCSKLRSKTTCANLLSPCSSNVICCQKYVCKDYRCAPPGTADNKMEWAPKGLKCDWFHHCKEGFDCRDNRCFLSVNV